MIQEPERLRRFGELWAARTTSSAPLDPDFELILDIDGGPSQGRWHYDTAGFARILSAKASPTYKFNQPTELNAVLGIE